MPWAATDKERIRTALDLSADKSTLDVIAGQMAAITTDSPDSIVTVQNLLTTIESVTTSLNTDSEDRALIKAGSLAWDVKYKSSALDGQLARLRRSLTSTLGLHAYAPSAYTQAMLLRS